MERRLSMERDDLIAVVKVLKERFNSLTAEELIVLAAKILESIGRPK